MNTPATPTAPCGRSSAISSTASTCDPLVRALRAEDAPNDLLRLITVESQFIVDYGAEQLGDIFERSWVRANHHDANVLGQAIARAALSFLALPPTDVDDAATSIARVLAPYIESIRTPS